MADAPLQLTDDELSSIDSAVETHVEEKGDPAMGMPPSKHEKQRVKRDSPKKLFMQRMIRDGREKEWYARLRDLRDQGIEYNTSYPQVMRDMGYVSPVKERELHEIYLRSLETTDRASTQAKAMKKFSAKSKEQQAQEDFDNALSQLPDKAPTQVEIDWIKTHPAMTRGRRMSSSQNVVIDANDILYSSSKKAPSKYAANALSHWANNPNEFFKMVLSEDKKKSDGKVAGEKEGSKNDDLDELERMVREAGQ